jgi:hypothetical protein
MTTITIDQPASGGSPAIAQHDRAILAAALRHLLARDGDHPARWATQAFGQAVEAHRADITGGRLPERLSRNGSAALTHPAASTRLAVDPLAVAVAIRQLETSGGLRLGSWRSLLRSGLPATPTALDVALWFG